MSGEKGVWDDVCGVRGRRCRGGVVGSVRKGKGEGEEGDSNQRGV